MMETINAQSINSGSGIIRDLTDAVDRTMEHHAGWGRYPGITAIAENAGRDAKGTTTKKSQGNYTYNVMNRDKKILFCGTSPEIMVRYPYFTQHRITSHAKDGTIYLGKFYFQVDSIPQKGKKSNRPDGRKGKGRR